MECRGCRVPPKLLHFPPYGTLGGTLHPLHLFYFIFFFFLNNNNIIIIIS
jgi:hypothetical protein